MRQQKPAGDVARRLERAIDRVGMDTQKARILAAALCGFAQPVPEYEALRQHLLRPAQRIGGEDSARDALVRPDFYRGF
jgi:hypothetical protein